MERQFRRDRDAFVARIKVQFADILREEHAEKALLHQRIAELERDLLKAAQRVQELEEVREKRKANLVVAPASSTSGCNPNLSDEAKTIAEDRRRGHLPARDHHNVVDDELDHITVLPDPDFERRRRRRMLETASLLARADHAVDILPVLAGTADVSAQHVEDAQEPDTAGPPSSVRAEITQNLKALSSSDDEPERLEAVREDELSSTATATDDRNDRQHVLGTTNSSSRASKSSKSTKKSSTSQHFVLRRPPEELMISVPGFDSSDYEDLSPTQRHKLEQLRRREDEGEVEDSSELDGSMAQALTRKSDLNLAESVKKKRTYGGARSATRDANGKAKGYLPRVKPKEGVGAASDSSEDVGVSSPVLSPQASRGLKLEDSPEPGRFSGSMSTVRDKKQKQLPFNIPGRHGAGSASTRAGGPPKPRSTRPTKKAGHLLSAGVTAQLKTSTPNPIETVLAGKTTGLSGMARHTGATATRPDETKKPTRQTQTKAQAALPRKQGLPGPTVSSASMSSATREKSAAVLPLGFSFAASKASNTTTAATTAVATDVSSTPGSSARRTATTEQLRVQPRPVSTEGWSAGMLPSKINDASKIKLQDPLETAVTWRQAVEAERQLEVQSKFGFVPSQRSFLAQQRQTDNDLMPNKEDTAGIPLHVPAGGAQSHLPTRDEATSGAEDTTTTGTSASSRLLPPHSIDFDSQYSTLQATELLLSKMSRAPSGAAVGFGTTTYNPSWNSARVKASGDNSGLGKEAAVSAATASSTTSKHKTATTVFQDLDELSRSLSSTFPRKSEEVLSSPRFGSFS
ncbi:unnamed protein product [Amoebophrya sp. A120]|nr:unnamed protein product [Amoebophrya sp. A120]|eukprot:GSA120T00009634001.1